MLKEKTHSFNLFLLNKNVAFTRYLEEDVSIKYNLQIDKDFFTENEKPFIDSGKIFIIKKTLREPPWIDIVNQLKRGKNKIVLNKGVNWTTLIFLKLKDNDQPILIAYGNTEGILKKKYITNDFGSITAKQIVNSQSLRHIKIQSFDDRKTQIQKGSFKSLNENHLIEPFQLNTISDFLGTTQIDDLSIRVGGTNSLKIRGTFSFKKDLLSLINSILKSYNDRHLVEPKFNVRGNINAITDKIMIEKLNKYLHDKLEILLNSNKINGNSLRNLYIYPNQNINHDNFIGYTFTSIGFPTDRVFNEHELDTAYIFERIQRALTPSIHERKDLDIILHKLRNIKVELKYEDSSYNEIISFYDSLYFEKTANYITYIFLNGKWYGIDNNFYTLISKEIDNICTKKALEYIQYDTLNHKDENEYNTDLAIKTETLELDCTRYKPSKKVFYAAQISPQSNVEIADVFNYDSDKETIQFIHIKKLNGGASQTIHSFTQAKSAAQIYANDRKNVEDFINDQRRIKGLSSINFKNIRSVEVIVTFILPLTKVNKANNTKQLFTILERISLYETLNIIAPLGFKFKLNFIDSNIK